MKSQTEGQIILKLNQKAQVTDNLFVDDPKSITTDRIETDRTFAERLFALRQKKQMLEKHVFAQRPELSDEEYQLIEKTGDLHYRCQLINQNSNKDPTDIDPLLKCKSGCGKYAGENVPYCLDVEDQFFLGPGVLLFFYYNKKIILMVIACVLIFGVYALVTNIIGKQYDYSCSEAPGSLPFLCEWKKMVSLPNKDKNKTLLIIQLVLGVLISFFWAFGIRVIRDIGRHLNKEIDDKLDSSSDYCIWLEGLPTGNYNEKDVIMFMSKLWRARKQKIHSKLKIQSVQIIYKTDQIRKKISEIQTLGAELCAMFEEIQQEEQQMKKQEENIEEINITKHNLINDVSLITNPTKVKVGKKKLSPIKGSSPRKQGEDYIIIEERLENYKQGKKDLVKKYQELRQFRLDFFKNDNTRKKLASDTAIVEFTEDKQQDEFLQNYGRYQESKFKRIRNKIQNLCKEEDKSLTFKGNAISIFRSPQPSDINWVNAQIQESNLRVAAVWGINIILIGITFGALMLYRYLSSISPTLAKASFIKIIILNLFNRMIWHILNSVIEIQNNKTKTESIVSVMNKSYLGQSFNIIVLPMIMNYVIADNLNGVNGLAGAVHDYQLTAFLFMILFNLINIPHRLTQFIICFPCTRKLFIKYLLRVQKFESIEEIKDVLAFLYEPPKLPVAGLYVYITTTVNQAFFFCHFQPVILFYLLFNLTVFYFVNRHLLLRMCKIPDLLDFFVFETVIIYAMNVPLFYAVGSVVLIYLNNPDQSAVYAIPSVLVFLIWFISSQNPFGLFQKMVHSFQECVWGKEFQDFKSESQNDKDQNIQGNEQEQSNVDKQEINKRRENYYSGSNMIKLFNFENILGDLQGPYHNKLKNFCAKFSFNNQGRRRDGKNKLEVENIL